MCVAACVDKLLSGPNAESYHTESCEDCKIIRHICLNGFCNLDISYKSPNSHPLMMAPLLGTQMTQMSLNYPFGLLN